METTVERPEANDAEAFVILQTAVTLAKQFQIKEAKSLIWRLEKIYPGKPAEIKKALSLWVDYEKEKRENK